MSEEPFLHPPQGAHRLQQEILVKLLSDKRGVEALQRLIPAEVLVVQDN
jgi:hypothetical protein